MEAVVKGINKTIVYIDDLLTHTETHKTMLKLMDQVLDRLTLYQVKINLPKYEFGSDNIAYLGF